MPTFSPGLIPPLCPGALRDVSGHPRSSLWAAESSQQGLMNVCCMGQKPQQGPWRLLPWQGAWKDELPSWFRHALTANL